MPDRCAGNDLSNDSRLEPRKKGLSIASCVLRSAWQRSRGDDRARTPEAVEADAPLGFILTAVLRLASFYPIRDLSDLRTSEPRPRDLLSLAAFGRPEFWGPVLLTGCFFLPRGAGVQAGCQDWLFQGCTAAEF